MEVRREPADVPAVAHRPERQERDQRVLCRVERPSSFGSSSEPRSCPGSGQNRPPWWRGRSAALERNELDPLLGRDRLSLVADDLVGHLDGAEDEVEPEPATGLERANDARACPFASVGCSRGRRTARRPRDRLCSGRARDEERLAEVEIDGALGAPSSRPRERSTRPSTAPVEASITVKESGSAERSGNARRRARRGRRRRCRAASAAARGRQPRPPAPALRAARRPARRAGLRRRRRGGGRRAPAGSPDRGSPPRLAVRAACRARA